MHCFVKAQCNDSHEIQNGIFPSNLIFWKFANLFSAMQCAVEQKTKMVLNKSQIFT